MGTLKQGHFTEGRNEYQAFLVKTGAKVPPWRVDRQGLDAVQCRVAVIVVWGIEPFDSVRGSRIGTYVVEVLLKPEQGLRILAVAMQRLGIIQFLLAVHADPVAGKLGVPLLSLS